MGEQARFGLRLRSNVSNVCLSSSKICSLCRVSASSNHCWLNICIHYCTPNTKSNKKCAQNKVKTVALIGRVMVMVTISRILARKQTELQRNTAVNSDTDSFRSQETQTPLCDNPDSICATNRLLGFIISFIWRTFAFAGAFAAARIIGNKVYERLRQASQIWATFLPLQTLHLLVRK